MSLRYCFCHCRARISEDADSFRVINISDMRKMLQGGRSCKYTSNRSQYRLTPVFLVEPNFELEIALFSLDVWDTHTVLKTQ